MNLNRVKPLRLHSILKELIAERGASAREVGRACGIPQSTLTSFLSGRRTYKLEQLLALSEYFEVTLEYLLFGDGNRPTNLDGLRTESLFDGWAKIRIERLVRPGDGPDGRDGHAKDRGGGYLDGMRGGKGQGRGVRDGHDP